MHQKNFEFVTFRAFRAHVPYVVPTCLTYLYVSRAYVPSCLKLLRPYFLGALNYYVAMCLWALNYCVPTWLRADVSSFFTCLYILACQYKFFAAIYLSYLLALIFHVITCLQPLTHFYTSYCCFSLDHLTFYPIQNHKTKPPASKTAYCKLYRVGVFDISTSSCTETIMRGPIKKFSKIMDSF